MVEKRVVGWLHNHPSTPLGGLHPFRVVDGSDDRISLGLTDGDEEFIATVAFEVRAIDCEELDTLLPVVTGFDVATNGNTVGKIDIRVIDEGVCASIIEGLVQ